MSYTLCLLTAPVKYLFYILLVHLQLLNKRDVEVLMHLSWHCGVVVMRTLQWDILARRKFRNLSCDEPAGEFRRGLGAGELKLGRCWGSQPARGGSNRLLSVQTWSCWKGTGCATHMEQGLRWQLGGICILQPSCFRGKRTENSCLAIEEKKSKKELSIAEEETPESTSV